MEQKNETKQSFKDNENRIRRGWIGHRCPTERCQECRRRHLDAFPGERVGTLGMIDVASLPSGEWVFEAVEGLVSGLKPNSRYFVVINVETATTINTSNSILLPTVARVDGTNGAGKFLGRRTPNPNWDVLSDFFSTPTFDHLLMKVTAARPPDQSLALQPLHGATDILRDTKLTWTPGKYAAPVDGHIVYFSENFDDVNDGIGGVTLSAESYDPGRLDFNKTHYWRVDEVNGPPDFTVYEGNVWSFTTEPISYPITNITATASGTSNRQTLAEKTIDGSGLDELDLHGIHVSTMWLSAGMPAWIQYEFDKAYKLHELWVWNANELIESFLGFGVKDVVIEYSANGSDWAVLDGVGPLAQAPGADGYAANNVIDFGGATAKFVRIMINSVHGVVSQASLSEVRFLYKPVLARDPRPTVGATEATLDTVLDWRPGREAGSHQVYFSDDMEAVVGERTLIATTTDASYDLSRQNLKYGSTYYWKINEVNELESPAVHAGNLWHFKTPTFVSVDDMEAYKDEPFLEIWAQWVDGVDDPANGSLVGNETAFGTHLPETHWVYEGDQAMPMIYDNGPSTTSETTRTFDPPLDWVRGDPEVLSLFFLGDPTVIRGKPANDPAPLYVVIKDSAGQAVRVVHPDSAATQIAEWIEWVISLTELASLDLSSVHSMTLGVGGDGGTHKGKMFFDNIRVGTGLPSVDGNAPNHHGP